MVNTGTNKWYYTAVGLLILCLGVSQSPLQAQDSTFTVTVENETTEHPRYDEGYSEKYAIDGDQNPQLTLERGKTYYFIMDDVPSFHPFYLTTSSMGLGADEYSSGVQNNGATGNDTLIFTPPSSTPDSLYYQCTAHSYMGAEMTIVDESTAIPPAGSDIPDAISLKPNYPNPFNPTTTIEFGLSENRRVTLEVYNSAGVQVQTLAQKRYSAGFHTVKFDGSGLSSGIYMIRLEAGNEILTRSMTMLK